MGEWEDRLKKMLSHYRIEDTTSMNPRRKHLIQFTTLPQTFRSCLAPLRKHFHFKEVQHFLLFSWLMFSTLLHDGNGTLKALFRYFPTSLKYYSLLRFFRSSWWNPLFLLNELSTFLLCTLPPSSNGLVFFVVDSSHKRKRGKDCPLAHFFRNDSSLKKALFGLEFLLVSLCWNHYRIPIFFVVAHPDQKGHLQESFRQFLDTFRAPLWVKQVVVLGDAGFASKANFLQIQQKGYGYVMTLAKTWKMLEPQEIPLNGFLEKTSHWFYRKCSFQVDSTKKSKSYWVFSQKAQLKVVGEVKLVFSKRRPNCGPKKTKVLVTNLLGWSNRAILKAYSLRWSIEVVFKELKSGLHLGEMQVTKKPERVEKALFCPVLAYLLLLKYSIMKAPLKENWSIFQLKRQFQDDMIQERFNLLTQQISRTRSKLKSCA